VVCRGTDGWKGAVDCFASSSCRLTCTLRAPWTEPHTDPWLILTDLPPAGAAVAWYGLRAWIECGCKDCKRGGWDGPQTKMTRPERASRLWLARAVATLWTVSVGGAVEASEDRAVITLDALTPAWCVPLPVTPTRRSRPRLLRCFRRGVIHICATLLARRPLPRGSFVPLPWPATFPTALCSLREIRPFDTITDGHAGAPFPMLMSSSVNSIEGFSIFLAGKAAGFRSSTQGGNSRLDA